ncbi:hypothetical protein MTO96_010148 [Rhipicephalus appendiculatus]
MIVNRRNPGALGVRRIKKTPTVIVLFDGQKVPQYVLCDGVRYPCSLYRRQVDVCYACGDLGHRADVCPRAKTRRNAADVACTHHQRIINAIPSVPSVEERTRRRTASAESASRCRTSCAKDGGAAGAHEIHS